MVSEYSVSSIFVAIFYPYYVDIFESYGWKTNELATWLNIVVPFPQYTHDDVKLSILFNYNNCYYSSSEPVTDEENKL